MAIVHPIAPTAHRVFPPISIYGFVFATGAAGLVYEVVWQRYLAVLFGSDTAASAVILATFLGGLSVGYLTWGKRSVHVQNPFRFYAYLEAAVGVWCLAFPWLFEAVASLTRPWSFHPPFMLIFQGVLCSVLLTGVPTFCMGGTIPVLTRALAIDLKGVSSVHARVYGWNTAGAVLGTLLAGFHLVPRYGLGNSIRGTAIVNLAAGAFFLWLSVQAPGQAQVVREVPLSLDDRHRALGEPRMSRLLLYTIAALSGFTVMTLETVLIRITNLSVGSSSYSFTLVVAVFILGIALGSLAFSRLKTPHRHLLCFNQFLIALSLLPVYWTLDTWPYWAHLLRLSFESTPAGFWGYYASILGCLALLLLVPTGGMGATVPILFHELKRDLPHCGEHSGMLLSCNTLGSLAGGLLGGLALYHLLDGVAAVFLAAVAVASFSALLASWRMPGRYPAAAAALTILVLVMIPSTPFFQERRFSLGTFRLQTPLLHSLDGPGAFFDELHESVELKFYRDGPAATVAVLASPELPGFEQEPLTIMINGKSDSSTVGDASTLKLAAHLPALLALERRNIMVIGLGTGATVGELTLYPDVERIDVAEISATVVEALPLFADFTYNVHRNPKVRIHQGDAFRVIGRSSAKWDLVISEPSNPWVTGVDLLFTREFYRMVREHLTENGRLLQWIHIFDADAAMVGMILNTLRQEFRECRVFMSQVNDLLILAGNQPVSDEQVASAGNILKTNKDVSRSLGKIDLDRLEAILVREIWPPSTVREAFSSYGLQTTDHPRLHYMAGRSFFLRDRVPESFLVGNGVPVRGDELLLLRKMGGDLCPLLTGEDFPSLLLSTRDRTQGEDTFLPVGRGLLQGALACSDDSGP